MLDLPVVTLRVNENGMPQGVLVDGHELPAVKVARVIGEAGELLLLQVDIYCGKVITEQVQA